MKALVVSADAASRDLLGEVLAERRHDVVAAADVEAVWNACHASDVSLVLLDRILATADGLDLCRPLRAHFGERGAVILVLLDRADTEEMAAALDAGASDCLVKPLDRNAVHLRLAWAERQLTEFAARRDAGEALAYDRDVLQAVLDSLSDPVYFKDTSSRFTRLNQATVAALGCEHPDQVLGKTDIDFYPPPLASQFLADERRILATGQPLSNQFEPQTGAIPEERWLLMSKAAVHSPDGTIVGIVGNAKDVTDHKRAEQTLAGQRHVLDLLASGTPLDQVLEEICRSLESMIAGAFCSVLLLDTEGHRLHYGAAPSLPAGYNAAVDGIEIGPNVGSCGTAAFLQEPVVVEDVATDPRWKDFRALALAHGLRACWSVPILDTADGGVLGTFAVYHREPHAPRNSDMTAVMEAGYLAGVAIRSKRAEAALRESEERFRLLATAAQRQAQELALMDQVRTALAGELDLPALFRTVVEATAAAFGYSLVSLYLVVDDVLHLQHQVGYDRVIDRFPLTTGVAGRVVRSGRSQLIADGPADPDFLAAIAGLGSEVCVPLRDAGQVVGVLILESRQGVVFGDDDLRVMEALAEHVNVAIGRARLFAEARASEARFTAFMDHSPAAAWMKDEQLRFVYVNQTFHRRFGVSAEDLQRQTDAVLFPAAAVHAIQTNDQAVLTSGRELETRGNGTDLGRGGAHLAHAQVSRI